MKNYLISATLGMLFAVGICGSEANATSILLDGTFQNSIGTGLNLTPWANWTGVNITRSAAPTGIPGNYTSIPVYGDLFQRFQTLSNGNYQLQFYVRDGSAWDAKLIVAVQQAFGTPFSLTVPYGTSWELNLSANGQFKKETFDFTISNNTPFPVNEFYFSNSYDYPSAPYADSVNRQGTVIDVANVSLNALSSVNAVPEPSTWLLMLLGFGGITFISRRRQAMLST